MAYYSFYKIAKYLFFTIKKYFKKFSLKIFTIIIVALIVFILYFSPKSSAHVSYYDAIETLTNGFPWVLFENTSGDTILCVSPTNTGSYGGKLSIGGATSTIAFLSYSPSNSSNNIQKFNYYKMNNDNSFTFLKYDYGYNNATGIGAIQRVGSDYSNLPSIIDMNNSVLWMGKGSTIAIDVSNYSSVNPYISTSTTDISSWAFNILDINGGTTSPYFTLENNNYPYLFNLQIIYNDTTYLLDINDYVSLNENTNTFTITIPRLAISSLFNFNLSSNISFNLLLDKFNLNGDITETITYNLDTYTFTLTQNDIDTINQDSLRYKITENSNVINNINTSINNDNIPSNSVSDFNNIDNNLIINDTTSINTIFDNIYNAFTTKYNDNNIGYGYTLSLTIPFTNKTLDISPHTIYGRSWADAYQSENQYNYPAVQIIYRFITSLWWFVIGLYILKDVRGMINKIAEGNIEDVSCDVKKELL